MTKILQFFASFFTNSAPAIASANPMITLAIFAVEEAIKEAPEMVAEFQALFAAGTPDAATFAALRAKVAAQSYASLVPNSALPPETGRQAPNTETVTAPPGVSAETDATILHIT